MNSFFGHENGALALTIDDVECLNTFGRPQMEMKIAELLVKLCSRWAGDGSRSWVSSRVSTSLLH